MENETNLFTSEQIAMIRKMIIEEIKNNLDIEVWGSRRCIRTDYEYDVLDSVEVIVRFNDETIAQSSYSASAY